MPAACRSIPASPNVSASTFVPAVVGGMGSVICDVLIDATAPLVTVVTLLQHGNEFDASHSAWALPPPVSHRWNPIVGLVPPCERSYLMRMSLAVRIGVTPLPTPGWAVFWFSSKSMFVVPLGAWTRRQARYRKSCTGPPGDAAARALLT